MNIGAWSAVRVTVVAIAWPIAILVLAASLLTWLASRQNAAFVSAGILEGLAILFGPPVLLVLVWLILRRGGR
jgi:hypothetical protein